MKRLKSLSAKYEMQKIQQGFEFVIGCDEVGRACLAGPVVAGAVVLNPQKFVTRIGRKLWFNKVNDSKQVLPHVREELEPLIKSHALAWGIGVVSEKVIDEINIHHASLLAMRRAVENLLCHSDPGLEPGEESLGKGFFGRRPQDDIEKSLIVLDGKFLIPKFNMEQEAIVDGDAKILSVAAASIIAKVYRDNLMRELHMKYPNYHLDEHKGYPTLKHRTAIKKFGLSPLHRLSFCQQYI